MIQHPVLILQTQNDFAVPIRVGTYLAATLPYSHFVLLPAEGHFPHMSAPQAVNAAISAFMAELLP